MSPLGKIARRTDGAVGLSAVVAASLFLLALPPAIAAAATTYHVAPGGTGGTCSVAEPCNIVEALSKLAKPGDVVAVAGNQGTYGLPNNPTLANIVVPAGVTLEGEPGQPMPVLYTEANGLGVELGSGAKLVDFAVHDEKLFATAVFAISGTTLERILATSNNGAGCIAPFESTVLDSACSGSVGIFDDISGGPTVVNLRNDTFYGSGEGGLFAAGASTYVIEAVNTIFLSPGPDIRADNLGSATVEVAAANSSYSGASEENGATVTPQGTLGNQTAAPLLVNPAGGDLHELGGSPTIDAALTSPANGTFDLDGSPRSLASLITCAGPGPALPDIGAYEFVPQAPTCTPESHPQKAGVRILALRRHGSNVTVRFAATGVATRFQCRLDRQRWRRCHSPKRYHRLKPGKHRLALRAVGPKGATFARPVKRRFFIP